MITPVEQVFFVYPVLTAKPVFDVMLKNGNKMAPEQFAEYIVPQNGMLVRVRMSDGRFAAVYEYQEDTWSVPSFKNVFRGLTISDEIYKRYFGF